MTALAWGLPGIILLVLAGALVLLPFNGGVMTPARIVTYGFAMVAIIVYAGVGGLIVARVPGNPIGWLLCLLGLALAASLFVEQYGLRGLATAPASLPAVRQIAALGASTTLLTVAPLIILVLLFPDGHLPSRRWRPVLWAAVAAAIVTGFGQLLQRGLVISGSLTNALLAAGVAFPNPFGVFPRHGWYSDVIAAMAVVAGIAAVLALVSVFIRRRGASAELRQQLAWLAYVGALTAAFAVVMAGYSLVTGGDTWVGSVLFILTFGTPIFGIPLACAVAVLRYRLYDLDIVSGRPWSPRWWRRCSQLSTCWSWRRRRGDRAAGRQPAHVRGSSAGGRAAAARPHPGRPAGRPAGLRHACHTLRGAVGILRTHGRYVLGRGRPAADGPDAGGGHRRATGEGVAADVRPRASGGGVAVPGRAGARRARAGAHTARAAARGGTGCIGRPWAGSTRAGHSGAGRRGHSRAAGCGTGGGRYR
jgi:hypothetical protein